MREDDFESMIDRAIESMHRAFSEVEAAHKAGKELIQIICPPDTRRGDIIKVIPKEFEGEHADCPDEDKLKARVLAVQGMTGIDPETMEMHRICEAVCAILRPGDITTEEEFAGLYGEDEDSEETEEAVEAAEEPQDPNVCECGANREMCERNQNMFGGHVNE